MLRNLIILSLALGLKGSSLNFDVEDFLQFVHDSVSNGDLESQLQDLSQDYLDIFYQINSRRLGLREALNITDPPELSQQCLNHMADYVTRWALPFDGLLPKSGGNWPRKSK